MHVEVRNNLTVPNKLRQNCNNTARAILTCRRNLLRKCEVEDVRVHLIELLYTTVVAEESSAVYRLTVTLNPLLATPTCH